MARSGARRKQKAKPRVKLQPRGVSTRPTRPATRPEYSAVESAMFFPKLRRQAKWMFVFLALVFALGFVVFGVGSGGGGLGDVLQNLGGTSGGPSVDDAKKKIEKGDLAAYKELAEAYRANNEPDKAIGTGRIDQELNSAATTELTDQYTGIESAYRRATQLYQRVAVANPDDVLLQELLAETAYQSRQVPVAIKASKRVIELAPGSAEAQQARQLLKQLRLQQQAGNLPSG